MANPVFNSVLEVRQFIERKEMFNEKFTTEEFEAVTDYLRTVARDVHNCTSRLQKISERTLKAAYRKLALVEKKTA
jgi:hypothetical protein